MDSKPIAVLLLGIWIILCAGALPAWAAPAATSTTLAVTSTSGAVTTVDSGSMVTLTAMVKAGTAAVTTGQVKFCDAAATYCTDIHLLGMKQLTGTGTAVLKFVPGIGSHSYKAVFLGTANDAASISGAASLAVTKLSPAATTITKSGSAGNYTLMATVAGMGGLASPTGTVSFLDTSSSGNSVLESADLVAGAMKLSFLNSSSLATGVGPRSVAAADFNGDGVLDLAVANKGGNSVTILLGAGDGTFSPAANSPVAVGSGPISIAAGDFNSDGIADLAVANDNSPNSKGSVTVLLGGGDGIFTEASESPVMAGALPGSVAVADLNGDGVPDLVVANFGDNTVSILLGKGDGTFSTAANGPVTVGPTPYSVTVADFNGDGVPDLAVANGSIFTVSIFLGNGDGTFTAAANSPVTPNFAPTFVAAGDFNGDGKTDLAVVNNGNRTVTILLGNGDGSFSQPDNSPVAVGVSPYSLVVDDFNGDGIADLAVANACGIGPSCKSSAYRGTLTVLLGDGKGTFTQAANSPLAVGIQPLSVEAGDFNGDGIADLAAANFSSGTVTVVMGQWTQIATATASGVAPLGTGTHMIDASYPGDGSYTSSLSATIGLTAQLGTPTVTVTPAASSITISQALSVAVTISGTPAPTGSVTLTSGSYTSAVMTLASDRVQIDIPAGSLAIGSETLTASYTPDSNSASIYNSASGTSAVTLTPAMSAPTVTVNPSASSITTAQPLAVTVAVAGAIGNPTPTGSVTMTSGAYISAATTLSNGSATINIAAGSLAMGSNTLTASYTPDSNSSSTYDSASGTSSAVTVTSAVSSSFTLSGTAVTFASGASTGNTSTITMTPSGGFTGSVALTASITASPAGALHLPTLSFGTTSPVSITGANAGTATLTISTTAATSATLAYPTRREVPWYAAGGTVLACILLFGIPARRRKWQTTLGLLVLLVALAGGVVSCGGGGNGSGGGSGASNSGTTAGSYTITVTGTSAATTQTGMVTLTVQ